MRKYYIVSNISLILNNDLIKLNSRCCDGPPIPRTGPEIL